MRDGEKPKRELAVCCNVDVINGGRADLFTTVSLISVIDHGSFFAAWRIFCTSSSFFGSSSHIKVIGVLFFVRKSAEITQKVSGLKARISRSLSIIIRRAGD